MNEDPPLVMSPGGCHVKNNIFPAPKYIVRLIHFLNFPDYLGNIGGRTLMIWLRILAGIALLVLGRKLFWLFVGLIGFVSGIQVATHFFPGQPEWMILAIALTAGVLGALLALFLQWLAIGLAGFFAGAYIVVRLLHVSGLATSGMDWLLFPIGGILGLILIIILFDWALIILSSLVGAGLITQSVHVDHSGAMLLYIALFIAGIVVQSRLMKTRS